MNKIKLLYEKESYLIRGDCFDLYKQLGSGHKEVVYQRGLFQLLTDKGLNVDREKRINIKLNGQSLGNYTPDFVIDNKILIETKAKKMFTVQDKKQFWQYLKATDYKLGFLVNFGKPGGIEIIRRVYDKARKEEKMTQSGEKFRRVPRQFPRNSALKQFIANFNYPNPSWDNLPKGFPFCNTKGLTAEEKGLLSGIVLIWYANHGGRPALLKRFSQSMTLIAAMVLSGIILRNIIVSNMFERAISVNAATVSGTLRSIASGSGQSDYDYPGNIFESTVSGLIRNKYEIRNTK